MNEQLIQTAELLRTSCEALLAVRADDQESVAICGEAIETTSAAIPVGVPLVPLMLNMVLEVLQRLYEGEATSPTAELGAAREVLELTSQWIDGGAERATAGPLESAGHGLWVLLGKACDLSPFVAASRAASGGVPAAQAPDQSNPTDDSAASDCVSRPPRTLEDLTALLIGLQASDGDELTDLADDLQGLLANADWPEEGLEQARGALRALRQVVASGAEAALSEAAEALGRVSEILEQPDELSLGPKAGVEPAEMAGESTDPPVEVQVVEQQRAPTAEVPAAATEASEDLQSWGFGGDATLIAEFVTESMDHLQSAEAALLELESDPSNRENLNAVFRGFHTIKGTAGFMGAPHIQKLAHHAEALLDRARNGEVTLTGPYADLALRSSDMLRTIIIAVQGVTGEQRPQLPAGFEPLLADLAQPEAYAAAAGDASAPPTIESADSTEITDPLEATRQSAAGAPRVAPESLVESSVRVRTDRLDALINAVGELVIANAMLVQDEVVQERPGQGLARKVSQVNKITRELQALGTAMRMVPLKNTFQKMARVARDVGQKAGKRVHFVTEGEETEIDRTMVEALGDPLLHMIRNAVDHGLEAPGDRLAVGKPETGTVTLRAYHAAGVVVIELQDDGRGLDRDRILRKAIANGLVEEGREMSDSEVYELVFAPGLSTAEKVTDVSGRGVGMDVVARNLAALHGRVNIASEPGTGTTFTIQIPLTLAIMDGMLVQVGTERYIIPTISIQQAFRATDREISSLLGTSELVMFRERLLPIIRLHRVFGITGAIEDPTQALLVVAGNGNSRYALMVDELLGQQQIVIKSLGQGLKQVHGVSGSAILGDGRVGLILDLAGISHLLSTRPELAVA